VGIVANEIVVTALEGAIVDVDIDVYVYRAVLILPPIAQRRRV
jgi:hypothetical protein